MTEQFVRKMEEGVKLLGIQLSEKQLEQFYDYFQFLVEKNKVMNLTAITEEDAVITKHFCDSLCLVKGFSDIEKTVSLIDVGTGAGFPGIPLKITFPHLKVTLLDSLNKRVRFLEKSVSALILKMSPASMQEQRMEAEIRISERNLICAYPVQWLICPLYQNIVCHL